MNINLCKIGIHKYIYSRDLIVLDPAFHVRGNPYKRYCKKCGKRQYWLPGHGGSELGCWLNDN